MKRLVLWTVVAMVGAAMSARAEANKSELAVKADVDIGKKPGAMESVTVVQPTPDGGMAVISKEVVTEEKDKKARPQVAADTSPRKARVVVVPAVFSQDIRAKFARELTERLGLADPSVIENPGYTTYLVDALVNCRKFDVLEREALKAAIKELDFGESDSADLAKVVKVGNMLNADYVIIPEIRYLGLLLDQKDVPYIGKQSQRLKGKLSANVRTVDVKTSKIVSSFLYDTGVTNRLRKVEESPGSPVRDLIDKLYGDSALTAAASVIDTAYPIKVVAVGDGTCVLNRGEGAIREGEVLNIYKPGEVMIDPDTKESLGYHEAKIGKVKVTKVAEKTCTAEILSGAGKIGKLDIGRRDVKPEETAAEQPAPKLD